MAPDSKQSFPITCPSFAKIGDTLAVEYEPMQLVVAMGKQAGEPMEFPLSNGLTGAMLVPAGKNPGDRFEQMVPGLRVEAVSYITKQRLKKVVEGGE